ncbi:hypothetical protein JCM9279_005986 [Rhodotorula babjevae]
MSIQAIDRTSVHRLTSGQVVVDLQTAVKELVENALDAGATSVDITFRDAGVESIEVKDNGKGIDQSDWDGIALKHHTSKLASFADLAAVATLGFRGEALSSLCGVATLSMVTSTTSTAPMGTALAFAPSGACTPAKKVARERGTTVKVERLFDRLPVRRKELVKNAQRELAKALALIQAYALVNVGVRFEARNVTKGKTLVQLKTTASTSLRTAFSYLFSPKDLPSLLDLDLSFDVATEKSVMKRFEGGTDDATTIRVKGLISKPSTGHGRTSGNRQFYYINGRPFQPAKVAKAVNEVYKSFNASQFPCVVADFQLAPDAYDVNVSPDKRTIFLHSEGNLIAALKQALARFFDPQQARFEMREIGATKKGAVKGKGKAVKEEDEGEEEAQSTDAGEEDDEEEPPRKKRRGSECDDADSPTSSSLHTAPMDIDLDATALVAATAAHASASSPRARSPSPSSAAALALAANDAHLLAAFPDDPAAADADDDGLDAGGLVLPDPPSPLKRAASALSQHDPADPAAPLETPDPRVRPPSRAASPPIAPSGALSPAGRSSPSPTPAPSPPLFRHASPTPRPPSPSPSPRSPSPAASAAPAPSRAALRQPTLSFLGAPAASGSGRGGGGTKRARAQKPSASASASATLQSHLRRFVRGAEAETAEVVEEVEQVEEEQLGALGAEDEAEQDEAEQDDAVVGSAAGGDEADEEDEEDEGDELVVVEDSFRAPSPSLRAPVGATQGAELGAASCVCVHGSQDDEEEDADDVEIVDETPPAPTRRPSRAVQETDLPFGAAPAEVAGTVVAADTDLALDFAALSAAWTSSSPSDLAPPAAGPSSPSRARATDADELAGAAIGEHDEAAEATLSRIVSKDDFAQMDVVGQFNLGFIIARRRVSVGGGSVKGKERAMPTDLHDDLFIIDQHASDEKYNFEKLQAETVIQSQRLIAPRILNLASADELTAMEHVDLLRLNGFDVLVDEDADVGERVKLIAQPVSKDTVFDTGDLEELVDLIGSRSGNEVVRPSKARRMFASRACRKSVMVGKALNVKQMTQILRNMSSMDQPWACPHGRPTMRWLAGLSAPLAPDPRFDVVELCSVFE